jgi:hypothetical protein
MTYLIVQIPKKRRNKKDKGNKAVVESSTNDDILIDKVGTFFIFAEVLHKHAVHIRNMFTLNYVIA